MLFTISHQLTTAVMGWLMSFLPIRLAVSFISSFLEMICSPLALLPRLQFLVTWMVLIVSLLPPTLIGRFQLKNQTLFSHLTPIFLLPHVLIRRFQLMNRKLFSHLTQIMLDQKGGFAALVGVEAYNALHIGFVYQIMWLRFICRM